MGGINITEANGQLGGVVTVQDGIVGMVLTGVSEVGGYTLGAPVLLTSLADLTAAGITKANNPFAYKHVSEFYSVAPVGSQLYLMLVSDTMTIANISDNTNAAGAKVLYNFAAGKIKVMGLCTDDKAVHTGGGTITITNGLNADVYIAASNAKVMEAAFRAIQMPSRIIIGGSSYSGVASALTDESTGTTNNKVAILIGDTQVWDATYPSACIGLCLGKVAASAVQEKISKVENGPLPNTVAYLGTVSISPSSGDPAIISGKNFITWRTFPQVQGFFFSGDTMLTTSLDDYEFLARGRTIDKAHIITYAFLISLVDADIPTVNGTITVGGNQVPAGLPDPGWVASTQQKVITQLSNTMVAAGNCSSVSCFIDPAQDVRGTNTLKVVIIIDSVAYLMNINVNLGF